MTETDALLSLRRELRTLPARKRIDRILDRKDAMRVVRTLPVHDLYATVREVGIEDCLEVLELCAPRQVQTFLDLDGWRGDRIDSVAMSRWLQALFAANPERAVGQLRGLDLELLTLLFKMHTRVYDLAAEEAPEEEVGLHTVTPDHRYLIVYAGVADDPAMQAILKEAVERLLGRDALFVLRLCEAVRWELPSSLEEECHRWRNARLADLGFLPKDEAFPIFAFLDPDALTKPAPDAPERAPSTRPRVDDPEAPSTDLSTSVVFPWDALEDGSAAFAQAARGLTEDARERVTYDVMIVANHVSCAEGADLGDTEAQRETARQVIDTVGVALAYASRGDPALLPTLLATRPVRALFRAGCSLGLRLQRELRAVVGRQEGAGRGEALLLLDTPLRELAAGLLRPRPLLYGGLLDPQRTDYRPARSLVELAAAARAISEIAFRMALFGPRGFAVQIDTEDVAALPSHGAILGAILAQALVEPSAPPTPRPFPAAQLAALRDRTEDAAAREAAVTAVVKRARPFAPLPGASTADDVEAKLRGYGQQVLSAVMDEVSHVLDADPDARFLSSLWISEDPAVER